MPMSYELPCGWTVRFSTVKMYDADKQSIEQGVQPHIKIDIEDPSEKDDMIETVIELTKERRR